MALTIERLKQVLDYNPATGCFRWRDDRRGGVKAGEVAGSVNVVSGYRIIGIDCELYYAHRLAWFWLKGSWPTAEVDHENLNRDDNSERNLRHATKAQQRGNQRARVDSRLGVKGVSQVPSGRYRVKVRDTYVGTFDTIKEAAAAYESAALKSFGEFSRTS